VGGESKGAVGTFHLNNAIKGRGRRQEAEVHAGRDTRRLGHLNSARAPCAHTHMHTHVRTHLVRQGADLDALIRFAQGVQDLLQLPAAQWCAF